MKKMTLNEKYWKVRADDKMLDEYLKRMSESEMQSLPGKVTIKGKKVGIHRFINQSKYVAAGVYDEFNK